MTNHLKGTVSQEVDGERINFRLSVNEWCELEAEHGVTTDELLKRFSEMAEASSIDMIFLRTFFRAAISGARPETTIHEAGAIMANMGLVEAASLIGQVVLASIPDASSPNGTGKSAKGAPGKRKPPVSPKS